MVNDKYLYLIQLCMELQRGEDGRIEERMADENQVQQHLLGLAVIRQPWK